MRISPAAAVAVAGLILAGGVTVALATGDRLAMIGAAFDRQAAQAGFKVSMVHVQGASALSKDDIIKATGLREGQPILGVDLNSVRARVEKVGWVTNARVVRLLPDTIVIAVDQRPAVAVWQHAGRLRVIDETGKAISEADPADFPALPLVVGEGAAGAASDVLKLIAARPRLMARVDALVRVDDRRWDLRLKDGGLIQLPAFGQESALVQLDRLDGEQRILDLGLQRIDLREPGMMAVRPRTVANTGPPMAEPAEAAVG